jgi:hypothetical protein
MGRHIPQIEPLRAEIRRLSGEGRGPAAIAKALEVSRSMVYTTLRAPRARPVVHLFKRRKDLRRG